MKPITIAGGGLAGLGLGIALRNREVPVVLHEAGDYPRHRVCGEFISGISPETLERLGISDLFDDANRLRSTAWNLAGETIMNRDLPEPALGISRYRIDQRMAERFENKGGKLETGSRVRDEAKAESDSAPKTVWACGRRAVPDSPWLGLKIHARHYQPEADLEMHLGDAGYAGIAPVENAAFNVCGLFRRRPDIRAKGPDLLLAYLEANGLEDLANRLRAAELDESSFLGVSAFQLGRQEKSDGTRCTIGDAESMIAVTSAPRSLRKRTVASAMNTR